MKAHAKNARIRSLWKFTPFSLPRRRFVVLVHMSNLVMADSPGREGRAPKENKIESISTLHIWAVFGFSRRMGFGSRQLGVAVRWVSRGWVGSVKGLELSMLDAHATIARGKKKQQEESMYGEKIIPGYTCRYKILHSVPYTGFDKAPCTRATMIQNPPRLCFCVHVPISLSRRLSPDKLDTVVQ